MSEDINLDTGILAWHGSEVRRLDQERSMRLQLAALTDDNNEYLRTLGAILNDETGPNRVTAIVTTLTVLVADLNRAHVALEGQEALERLLRSEIAASLRQPTTSVP